MAHYHDNTTFQNRDPSKRSDGITDLPHLLISWIGIYNLGSINKAEPSLLNLSTTITGNSGDGKTISGNIERYPYCPS